MLPCFSGRNTLSADAVKVSFYPCCPLPLPTVFRNDSLLKAQQKIRFGETIVFFAAQATIVLKRFHPLLLSVISGLLLWLSWPVSSYTPIIFIAFVPLLFAERYAEKRVSFFKFSFLAMLIWNTGTTWWIWNATDAGAIGAIIANSLLMTLPWWGYRVFNRQYGQRVGFASLILFWMSFEYIHLNWQLSWPWLTLGNAFAVYPNWVQWYEYTGTSGGTLWILLITIAVFKLAEGAIQSKYRGKFIAGTAMLLAAPLIISFLILSRLQSTDARAGAKQNVIIVQPNIDPYEKFTSGSLSGQLDILISLSEKALDTNTALVVWPETALSASVEENDVQKSLLYKPVFDFINRHPQITLLTGIETFKVYGDQKATSTARFDKSSGIYYDDLNAAVSIKSGSPLLFYTKSKLVPGVETLPSYLNWMGTVFEQFGGTAGGYAHSDSSSVFREPKEPFVTAPIICYESIYGEYVSTYVKRGANLLTIITNDGWWKNTPGHKQHLHYACLRAIETRRYVARSANTGISAVIDETGHILQTKGWDEAAFIKADIPVLTGTTFYVEWGDLLSKMALAGGGLLIIFHLFTRTGQRSSKHSLIG